MPEQASPPAAPPAQTNGVDAAIEQFMNFDPFADGETPPQSPPAEPAAPSSGAEPPPAAQPGSGDAPPAGEPPAAPAPAPAAPSPEVVALQAQIQQLERLVPRPKQQEPAEDEVPPYMLRIPDEIMAGMESEDPKTRRDALHLLIAGIGRTVHRTMREEFRAELAKIPQMVQQVHSVTSSQKQVFDDFYGEYKDLNQKFLYPTVQEAARQVIAETKASAWTPELKKRVAQRTYQLLGRTVPGAPPAAPKPPPQTGNSSRPQSSAPGTTELQQELREILF